MTTLLVTVCIVLVSTGLQAFAAPEGFVPVVPVFRQPYGDADGSRIVNGKEAAVGQFPYQAGLTINGRAFCGGSLISKNWVLTAGHCIDGFSSWVATLGAHNIKNENEAGRLTITAASGVRHENYSPLTLSSDVGLVKLSKDVAFTDRIKTIALPPKAFQNQNFVGKSVRVSGWGRVSDSSTGISPTLQFVDLSIITNDECARVYGSIITNTKYCTSGKGGKGTCNGDSGGSLTTTQGNTLYNLGIVSFGAAGGCAKGYPAGYTATPFFVDWISQKTGISVNEDDF